MIKMIPPYISPDVTSSAESKLYELIKNSEDNKGYTCLHSLGLASHEWKRMGEIDFVVIKNGTILCLEVKGGQVTRRNGIWYFKDRFGKESRKAESPFKQACSAMYALKKNLETHFGGNIGYSFGYGVLSPDINFNVESPEWEDEEIYDINNSNNPITHYFETLDEYWKRKPANRNQHTRIDKQEIVNYLRGDFEIATPLWGEITQKENEIIQFTTEQYRALDHMEDNKRVFFIGGAGTGKTLLATEKARRLAFNNQRTILLCYNRLLGAKLAAETSEIDHNKLYVNSIHKYFLSIIEKAGMRKLLDEKAKDKSESEVFNEVYPEIFPEAFKKLHIEQFDALVIDEAQDLLNMNYIYALDEIIKGGFKEGRWTIFLDPGGQERLFNRYSKEAFDYLLTLGASLYRLDLNCRNTHQIALQTSVLSGFPMPKTRIDGPKVEYKYTSDDIDTALQVVELIKNLVQSEVPPSSITILTPRSSQVMSLFTSRVKLPKYLTELNEQNIQNLPMDKVTYSSVQSYKGLENNIIIYIDLSQLSGDWNEVVNYIAMSRARQKLYVFMGKGAKKDYEERVKSFLRNNG